MSDKKRCDKRPKRVRIALDRLKTDPLQFQFREYETFEDHVNITLPPNSKEISYWMYSMKTPGHIDMSHLLFHTTDDENNISSDTKNSAVRFNGFRRGCCTHNLSASFSCFLTPIFYYLSLLCSRSLLLDKKQQ